jgi:methionyl-tRNA formyltransferase
MKIVLFGNIDISAKVLQYLLQCFKKEDIYVVTDPLYKNNTVYDISRSNQLKTFKNAQDLIENTDTIFAYGFTIRYNEILKPILIDRFKYGVINMHGGPLPEYKGSANHIFAILNKENEFGVTIHYINEKIDEGNIIIVEKFPIEMDDTGYSLLEKTKKHGFYALKKIINKIKDDEEIYSIKQKQNLGKTYKIKDLKKYQYVDIKNISEEELSCRLRAFYHPEKDSLYTRVKGQTVHLKLI